MRTIARIITTAAIYLFLLVFVSVCQADEYKFYETGDTIAEIITSDGRFIYIEKVKTGTSETKTDFRGFVFGERLPIEQGFVGEEEGKLGLYTRNNEKLHINGFRLERITYLTYNEKLLQVNLFLDLKTLEEEHNVLVDFLREIYQDHYLFYLPDYYIKGEANFSLVIIRHKPSYNEYERYKEELERLKRNKLKQEILKDL